MRERDRRQLDVAELGAKETNSPQLFTQFVYHNPDERDNRNSTGEIDIVFPVFFNTIVGKIAQRALRRDATRRGTTRRRNEASFKHRVAVVYQSHIAVSFCSDASKSRASTGTRINVLARVCTHYGY